MAQRLCLSEVTLTINFTYGLLYHTTASTLGGDGNRRVYSLNISREPQRRSKHRTNVELAARNRTN
jgi:hypothetical protein